MSAFLPGEWFARLAPWCSRTAVPFASTSSTSGSDIGNPEKAQASRFQCLIFKICFQYLSLLEKSTGFKSICQEPEPWLKPSGFRLSAFLEMLGPSKFVILKARRLSMRVRMQKRCCLLLMWHARLALSSGPAESRLLHG